MDKDDELISRLIKGGDIKPKDLESNHENVKPINEGCNSFYYELGEQLPPKRRP